MHQVRLSTFVSTLAIVGAIIGALVGVAGLILSLLGAEVFIVLTHSFRLTGVAAGFVGVPLMPIVFGLMGVVVGNAIARLAARP